MGDIDSMPGKLDALSVRVGKLEHDVAENTGLTRNVLAETKDIREMLVVGKWTVRIAKGAGAVAIAVSAIWGALHLGHKQ